VFLVLGCLLLIWYANRAAVGAAKGRLYDSAADLPQEIGQDRVALVLGCSPKIGNRDNLYYVSRIEAALALWATKSVRGFIVSGDNSRADYNEPERMKESLMAGGVPEDKIVCDYAGLRTLDSVMRLKDVFGEDKVVIVSQRFHNERAIYLASHFGIDAVGVNAKAVEGYIARNNEKREYLARVKMLVDVMIGKKPKFLGDKESVDF